MQIKQERLKERIERINEMSRDETGGYTRLAFGEKETKARMMAKGDDAGSRTGGRNRCSWKSYGTPVSG